MTGGTWSVRTGWGSRIAASLALAFAIVVAGAIRPAQAAPWTVYMSESSNLTGWVGAETFDVVQSGDIGVGDTPMFLAANPSGTRVYVPNRFSGGLPTAPSRAGVGVRLVSFGFGNVSVIDTATKTVVTTIEDVSFDEPVAVAVKPDGSEAWVVNNFAGTVSIIDTATNLVTGTIDEGTGASTTPPGSCSTRCCRKPTWWPTPMGQPSASWIHPPTPSSTRCSSAPPTPYSRWSPPTGRRSTSRETMSRSSTRRPGTIDRSPLSILSTVTYLAVSNDGTKVYAAGNDSFLEIIDSSSADFTNDDFTDSFVDFGSAFSINTVAVVPGTDFGVVTDLNEGSLLWAFDTSTDAEILSDALPVSLELRSRRDRRHRRGIHHPAPPPPTLDLQNGGIGRRLVRHVRDGRRPRRKRTDVRRGKSAGMIALYFGLLLLPVGILKLVHGKKRFPIEKAGIVALFLVASMLVASSAHANRLVAPKAQRFHPTTDGLGAVTVDTDQTLCPGQFNFGLTLSGAKKPLDMGDIRELKIEKVVVDELYTADLTAAYGITPDITLGLDVPVDYSRDNLNYAEYLRGNTGVRDDVFHLGDIRLNAKFRVIERARYGLALIPFANFATGDKDFLLSEGKFGIGLKVAGHYDVAKPLTLYANLGVEHIGKFVNSDDPEYYHPWIQYGVGAKYLLPWRKDHIVAEVNGETSWATPYRHSTLSPLEFLAAYRTEVARGWTLQAGGGGGLNKGMGAPQWRAILGIAYKM